MIPSFRREGLAYRPSRSECLRSPLVERLAPFIARNHHESLPALWPEWPSRLWPLLFILRGIGFELGVNKKFSKAPVFYWLPTALILVAAGFVLIPGLPRIKAASCTFQRTSLSDCDLGQRICTFLIKAIQPGASKRKNPKKFGPRPLALSRYKVNLKSTDSGGKKNERHSQKRGIQQSF
jgi:hypothetical protein